MTRFFAACATHVAVGCAVARRTRIRRLACSITASTYNRAPVRATVSKKSHASSARVYASAGRGGQVSGRTVRGLHGHRAGRRSRRATAADGPPARTGWTAKAPPPPGRPSSGAARRRRHAGRTRHNRPSPWRGRRRSTATAATGAGRRTAGSAGPREAATGRRRGCRQARPQMRPPRVLTTVGSRQ